VRRFAYRRGSGGAGRHRGGDGLVREIAFRAPVTVALLSNHRRVAPFGLAGGAPGARGAARILRADGSVVTLPACAAERVGAGDSIVIETPGGGGFGAGR
jgi:5-oxoprolinase (ATP-hydrolysing)